MSLLSYPGRDLQASPDGRRGRAVGETGQVGSGSIYPPATALTLDQGTVREG